jgi:hypothetical protein
VKKIKIAAAIDLHDLHYPVHHKPTIKCLFDYLDNNVVEKFIFGGDQFHFDVISHHNKNKPLFRLRRGYMNDIEGFDREILTPLEAKLGPDCEKIWIIGNHERFEQDLIEEQPELEGAIGHVRLLNLVARGWTVIELGHAYRLGKLAIIHGETLSGIGNQAGAFPSKKAVELYACSVLAGHTHAPQTYTRVSPVDQVNKWQGYIAPIGGAVNPTYLRNRPTAWLNGFTRIEVFPNGNFNVYPIIVSGGLCAFDGAVYGEGK